MTPLTVVDRSLPPTVSVAEPRLNRPAPSIEPAVVPVDVRYEKSNLPPALAMKRALSPLLALLKRVMPPLLVMRVEPPAVLAPLKYRLPLLVMALLPAVLLSLKVT